MIRNSRLVPLLAIAVAASAAACHKPPPPAPPPAPVVNQDSIDAANRARQDSIARERARQDSIAAAEKARQDSIAAAQAAAARVAAAKNAVSAVIYFDFDKSDITDQSKATLDAKLPVLRANTGLRIQIAGHTDERGSDEYNMALGQRRAAAAKRYLVSQGITSDRIDLISYGEEHPVATGHDESAWSQNRRDEFNIVAGGDNIVAP